MIADPDMLQYFQEKSGSLSIESIEDKLKVISVKKKKVQRLKQEAANFGIN